MMKRLGILLPLLLCFLSADCLPAFAQTVSPLAGTARSEAIAAVQAANDVRTSLQFRFEMERHSPLLTGALLSRGRAAFVFPDKLRWETESPRPGLFVLNGLSTADRRFQSLFRNIQKISEKGLINESDFTLTVYRTESGWQFDMVPQRRDLGQLFSLITLLTDAPSGTLRSIVLTGTDGDLTVLRLSDVIRGGRVDESLFQQP